MTAAPAHAAVHTGSADADGTINLMSIAALVVSLISLTDMTFQAQVVRAQTGNTLVPFATILVLYFLMALAISTAMRALERRMARGLDGVRA